MRVAFWNVENFFDPTDDTVCIDDDFTAEGANHWTWKRFHSKCNAIYKTVVAMDAPMVLGLAEVENERVLRELCKGTPLRRLHYEYVHFDSPDHRGIDCALMYRNDQFRVFESRPLSMSDSTYFTRDVLLVGGVTTQNDTLFVLVNHWPSRRGSTLADRHRERIRKSVVFVRDSLLSAHPDAVVAVMGDFNAELSKGVGEGSYCYQGVWSWIDQIFVNSEFPHSATPTEAVRLPWLLTEDATHLGVKPYRTYLGPRYQGGISDHLPVVRALQWK